MRMSIGWKLTVLVGVLLAFFLILGFMTYTGVQAIHMQVEQIMHVEQPTTTVAYEMDVNLLRMVVGVLGYLENRDPSHLDRIHQGQSNFNRFIKE